MIIISHRGNLTGRHPNTENSPDQVELAISKGYDVMVDAWLLDNKWMLGLDFPKYEVPLSFFERPHIWTHAMNLVGYVSLFNNKNAHVFWNHTDDFTFTSKNIKWANTDIITNDGIMYLPNYDNMVKIKVEEITPLGVCVDKVSDYE